MANRQRDTLLCCSIRMLSTRGVAQPGSALPWGGRGHGFKSRRPENLHLPLLLPLILLALAPAPAAALSKGIADAEPSLARSEHDLNTGEHMVITRASAGTPLYALSTDAFAVEVASNVSRATQSWSEKLPVPILGGLIRSVVRFSEVLVKTKKNLKDNYGLNARRYGSGVAVYMQRRF